jgi:hypothetical protein
MSSQAKNDYARQLQDLPVSIHGYFVPTIAVLGPMRGGSWRAPFSLPCVAEAGGIKANGKDLGHPSGRPGRGPDVESGVPGG